MGVSVLLMGVMWALVGLGEGFPDGAPIEACILPEPNRPNHQGIKPQPKGSHKHIFVASGSHFKPDETIGVYIGGPPFKGYFIQARDARTHKWIGHFEETKGTTSFPECSAITHHRPGDVQLTPPPKEKYLIWHAPRDYAGVVYFTGTILERYDKYWSDLVAQEDPKLRDALLRAGYNIRPGY